MQTGYQIFKDKRSLVRSQQQRPEKFKRAKVNIEDKAKKTGDDEGQLNEKSSNTNKMNHLVKSSNEFEYRTKAFPLFELIPNEVVIDIHKVTFIDKTLLMKNVTSILINDISKVDVANDMFFGTLEIINVTKTIKLEIKHLKKDNARTAQAIIQGLMVSYKNNIDLAELKPSEMVDKLLQLGSPVS